MNDEWEDLMPDSGENGITMLEAAYDVVVFFARIVGVLLVAAAVVGVFAYSIWKEIAILTFLTS